MGGYTAALERPGSYPTYAARKFIPTTAGNVESVTVNLKANLATSALAVRLEVRDDDAGEPSDDVLELSSTVLTTLTGANVAHAFDFSGDTALALLTAYWVVMYRTDAQYKSVTVVSDRLGDSLGRNDVNGQQPWTALDRNMDIKVEGVLAGGGPRSWGVIIG